MRQVSQADWCNMTFLLPDMAIPQFIMFIAYMSMYDEYLYNYSEYR